MGLDLLAWVFLVHSVVDLKKKALNLVQTVKTGLSLVKIVKMVLELVLMTSGVFWQEIHC